MHYTRSLPKVTYDEVFDFTVDYLRSGKKHRRMGFGEGHSYDLYVYDVAYAYIEEYTPYPIPEGRGGGTIMYEYGENLGPFMEVAWSLVSSGIVVPGSFSIEQRTQGGSLYGFNLTEFGREWIASAEVTASPRRYGDFSKLLSEFDPVFGEFYAIRSQEALSCFRHGNHIACCAMAGACAETILFTAYVKHKGDEEQALKDMTSAGGRGRVEAALLGRLKEGPRMELQTSFSLIKYWRDNSAHGVTGKVSQSEAHVALLTLLSLAQAAQRHLL